MDELSEEDKQLYREDPRYLSQSHLVPKVFTGSPGKYVSLKDNYPCLKGSGEASSTTCRAGVLHGCRHHAMKPSRKPRKINASARASGAESQAMTMA